VIRTPEQLLAQPLIFSEVNVVQWPRWFASHGVPVSPATYALRFDRAYMAIGAAAQGLGVALESDRLAESLLASGALVPVFPDRRGIRAHGHHLVFPETHAKWTKVQRFVEWLKREVGKSPTPASPPRARRR
jgi:LysR family glycine cleavage system transcriptional activator